MRYRARFLHSPEGGNSSQSSEAALDHTFGGLENVRPDLAGNEAAETERREAGKPPRRTQEIGRPILDSERPPEEETDPNATEAALTKPPATETKEPGSDHESPDDETPALDALIEKYQGKTRSMAKAIRELRSLQTNTAEEKKAAEAQLEAVAAIIDADYDWVDNKPVLKPEVAARALRNGNGRPRGPYTAPTEDEVRASVLNEFREDAKELFEEDQIPAYLQKMRPRIEKLTAERMANETAKADAVRYNMLAEVGNIVERHLREHPEDKDIIGDVDKLYGNVPEELRHAAILDEWMPFGEMAELVRIKKSLPKIVKDAYELGKKHRGESGKPADSGAPGRSAGSAPSREGKSPRVINGIDKDAVIRGSGLASIDSLWK